MYILLTYQTYQIINLFIGIPGVLLKPLEKMGFPLYELNIYFSDRASEFTYCALLMCVYFIIL